ncbi:hypothetical protein F5Y06DRAFT_272101 [Hypoxylon sp. FL0890]|nr:hypothetical protein F5Y06DRAFT_272101 [Hypoxylon sp. FL0890]
MSSSRNASKFSFVISPPSNVAVGQAFRIKVRAPSDNNNGTMGFVSLAGTPSRPSELSEPSHYLEGTTVRNWELKGNAYDVMEFESLKVTHPGRYYLRIHFYGEPKATKDSEGDELENMGILESEVFQVQENRPIRQGAQKLRGIGA